MKASQTFTELLMKFEKEKEKKKEGRETVEQI